VKISDLQRLSQQADEHSASLARLDPKMLSLGAEAVRSARLARVDPRTLSLTTEALRTLPLIDMSKLMNTTAISDMAKSLRPIVAPPISEAMREIMTPTKLFTEGLTAFKVMTSPPPSSFTEALKGIEPFFFQKTLEDLSVHHDQISRAALTLGLPETFGADVSAALREAPLTSEPDFTLRFEAAAEEAIATAADDDVGEIVEAALPYLDDLSVADRRKLAADVLVMLAAFVMLAACLSEGAYRYAAPAALGAAGELLRVYWQLTRKVN
jgi:hypothetical protein